MPVDSRVKNPAKQRAARARWGPGIRVVRLDALTLEQRRLVLALIDAARKETAPVSEMSGTVELLEGHGNDRPAA